MWATWRSRSVGVAVDAEASTTSWPCAHVSISRAVTNERAPIAGPYHGTRGLRVDGAGVVDERADGRRASGRAARPPASAGPARWRLGRHRRSSACGVGRERVGIGDASSARWSKNQRCVI